jgi:glycosyltransferase involved in cell wall biosynthesis
MKIAVLLNEQYPYGMACTNRTHLYTKGLAELGNDVIILIPRPTETAGRVRNHQVSGIYEGVRFRYAYETIIRKSFIGRRIQNITSIINSFVILVRFRPDIILIVTNTLKYILAGKLASYFTGAKLVREKTEIPYYRLNEITGFRRFKTKLEFKLFDGIMVISSALKEFFANDLLLNTQIEEVPILIDNPENISNNGFSPQRKPILVYTGSLLDNKDGVITIIKAFSKILQNHPDARLVLTGDIERSADRGKILSAINELSLNGKVELPGYVSREKLIELTTTASALLLAKPENRQNRYNMATKTGEYLLTGRPAVISSVDPVCRYLKHREDACIVEPDDKRMADEIEFLLNNPEKADSIGRAGKDSVVKLFDYRKHARRINEFFLHLQSN